MLSMRFFLVCIVFGCAILSTGRVDAATNVNADSNFDVDQSYLDEAGVVNARLENVARRVQDGGDTPAPSDHVHMDMTEAPSVGDSMTTAGPSHSMHDDHTPSPSHDHSMHDHNPSPAPSSAGVWRTVPSVAVAFASVVLAILSGAAIVA